MVIYTICISHSEHIWEHAFLTGASKKCVESVCAIYIMKTQSACKKALPLGAMWAPWVRILWESTHTFFLAPTHTRTFSLHTTHTHTQACVCAIFFLFLTRTRVVSYYSGSNERTVISLLEERWAPWECIIVSTHTFFLVAHTHTGTTNTRFSNETRVLSWEAMGTLHKRAFSHYSKGIAVIFCDNLWL